MKEFFELTEEFAKRIVEKEEQRRKVGELLRKINSEISLSRDEEILEEKILFPVEKASLNLKIAGVDGGMLKRSLHGIDILLLRAVGVLFYYKNNKIEKVEYFPEAIPSPIPIITFEPFLDFELEINSNMERQIAEVNNASQIIEKFSPDILFLNGSIVPHYTTKPEEGSLLFPNYRRLIDSYLKLFSTASSKGSFLAGVIEDSRGTRFCDIVNKKIISLASDEIASEVKILLTQTIDSNLLTYALKVGERSFVFKYSSQPEEHPVLKDLGSFGEEIFGFYLKSAEFDRPIRVDFLPSKDAISTANKLSSVLLALTGHSSYGIPSVLIEADQRARLSEKDLEAFYFDLVSKAGNLPGLFSLRREQRPF